MQSNILSKLTSYVSPPDVRVPVKDVKILHEALKGGKVADVDEVASILGQRNVHERLKIKQLYRAKYKEDLETALRNSTSGGFQLLTTLWMLPHDVTDAMYVRGNIFEGEPETRDLILVEIACSRTPDELISARSAYHNMYKSSIEEDIASHRTGDIRKMLLLLFSSYRYPGNEVRWDDTEAEAEVLQVKIRTEHYNDDEIIRILTTRSHSQLEKTMYAYTKSCGNSILKDLTYKYGNENENEDEDEDDLRPILRVTVQCLNFPDNYFYKLLDKASLGARKIDLSTITRIVVSRDGVDFEVYQDLYK